MQTVTKKMDTTTLSKLDMFCEACGEAYPRWDMYMVIPNRDMLRDGGFGFACPECVEERGLFPLQTEEAMKFRRVNEKLREELSPVPIN